METIVNSEDVEVFKKDWAPQFIEVSTCCGSKEEAHKIARLAVETRLCACVHIIPI